MEMLQVSPKNRIAMLAGCLSAILPGPTHAQPDVALTLETEYAKCAFGSDGRIVDFKDRRTGSDFCVQGRPFARLKKAGKEYPATAARYADGRLTVQFGTTGFEATIKATAKKRYFVFEVERVSDEQGERFYFLDILLTSKGTSDSAFVGCALTLNLKTQVPTYPGPNTTLRALAYDRFGFVGTKAAVIGCPRNLLRDVIKEVVAAAPDLPHSPIGGPWALDGPINNGSYLFNFGDMSEETVGDWVQLAQRLGITQIDFHGGRSFRFGDCRPNPKTYPRGRASFKAVIDKLHAAGIAAGLHTYAQFMDKRCPYVTPTPHPELGKDATFTLAAPLTEKSTTVPVVESTEKMSTTTGFFVRNSVTLQIDDELITYSGVSKESPYAFTGCTRGAYGTRVATHAKGAATHHLRECFGRFVPDGDSPLYAEIAANTAEMYNECGFDMIYLDALDGSDAVAGREYSWHYAAKFTFEIWKRLERPAIMEMSTFPPHLWYVRARMGAWDHPSRSHKAFIDIHCRANRFWRNRFLPTHLGWWAFKTWHGAQTERTFPDDIEYLCGKCIGIGCGLSIMGIDPYNVSGVPALPQLAAIMKRYENLRHANYFADEVKAKLREPGKEHTLIQSPEGEWQFREVQYDKHRAEGRDNVWTVTNGGKRQPLQLRIEALTSARPYDAPGSVTIADFQDAGEFSAPAAKAGIAAKLEPTSQVVKAGAISARYSASSTLATRRGAWARVKKAFSPPTNLAACQAMGVWVHGDGKGEVLNLQLKNPSHISRVNSDHYIVVDFSGWRYFELVEPEGWRHSQYSWPYPAGYSIYRQSLRYSSVEALNLYYNNLPPHDTVTCHLSPIKALPTVRTQLSDVAVTVEGQTIRFPVLIPTGCYLEFRSKTDCKLYGPKGELMANVTPEGDVPTLDAGENEIRFTCKCTPDVRPRAYVTVISSGDIVRGRKADDQIKWELLKTETDDPRTITALDGVQNAWDLVCRDHADLEVEIAAERIESNGAAYSASTALSLEAFDDLSAFADTPGNQYAQYVVSGSRRGFPTSVGVTHELELCTDPAKVGKSCARYTATSEKANGWSARGRRFEPVMDLSSHTDMGFWLHGDGNGEILYLQLRDVKGVPHDLKTRIDFTGWKYVQFPLIGAKLDLTKVEYLIIYYNAIPAGKTVTCCVDDIRALRDSLSLANPTLSIAGRKLVFPVSLAKGDRLRYVQGRECKVFRAGKRAPMVVAARGSLPRLSPGTNRVEVGLDATPPDAFQMRVQVTKVYR